MYKKFLIVASKLDKAGINITTQLSQFRENPVLTSMKQESKGFDFYLVENEIIHDESLDMEKINQYDFVIFASKHKSGKGEKALTIHTPGNFRDAELGGKPGKISMTSALFQKFLFEKLNENVKKFDLRNYKVTLEATHHGPLIEKPCVFIEIGSTENEWKDNRAGFIVAKTISDSIKEFEKNSYREIAIAIGGPHYCPNFNKIQLNSNVAISHVISQYAFPLTENMVREAIDKTSEEVDFAVLDWKGLGTSEKRDEVTKVLDRLYVNYKRTSEIGKHD